MYFDRNGRPVESLNGRMATYFEDDRVLDLEHKITAETLRAILVSGAVDETRQLQCSDVKTLESLTDPIVRLRNLQRLHIRNAPRLLVEPPLWELESLEDVWIAAVSNKTDLAGFRPLPRLRKLYLSAFKLQELPPAIGGCTALETLELDYLNWLKVVPEEIAGLERLEKLKISGGRFTKVPDGAGRLPALRELRIYAPIRKLPDLSGLQNLRVLELYETKLKTLPDSLGQLGSLEELAIMAPDVTEWPDLSGLKNLRTFLAFGCRNAPLAPELAELPALQEIHHRPEQVADLTPEQRAAFGNRLRVES